jgi:hypothetical protein
VINDEDTRPAAADDDAIRALVKRLSRSHPSGGKVIERASILASGPDATAILAWIAAHEGEPEDLPSKAAGHGLHGGRLNHSSGPDVRTPLRYVLPPGALG